VHGWGGGGSPGCSGQGQPIHKGTHPPQGQGPGQNIQLVYQVKIFRYPVLDPSHDEKSR
jgi:hypothetical protein